MKERKLIFTADWHLGKTYNSKSLLPFQEKILNGLVDTAIQQNIDWFIIAGDIYDKRRPNRDEMQVFEDILKRLNEAGIGIVVIAGNHDGDVLTLYNSLLNKHSEGKVLLIKADSDHADIPTEILNLNNYSFYALPYIDRPSCLQLLENKGIPHKEQNNQTLLDTLISHWLETLPHPEHAILITHLLPSSLTVNESGADEVVGQMIPVNTELFQSIGHVFSGHIHRPIHLDPNIIFIGSPYHLHPNDKFDPSALIVTISETINISRLNIQPHIFETLKIENSDDLSQIKHLTQDHYYIIKISGNEAEELHKTLLGNLPDEATISIEFEQDAVPVSNLSNVDTAKSFEYYTPISLIKTYAKEVHNIDLDDEEVNLITEILEKSINDEVA